MDMKQKVKPMPLMFVMIAIMFAAFNCEDQKPTDSNGDEIIWQQTALDSLKIISLATNSSGDVFAGSSNSGGGIFRSTDRGDGWHAFTPYVPFVLAINSNDDIFGTFRVVVIRSTDNGESWTSLVISLTRGVNLGPIAFNASGEIFVGSVRSDETSGGLYRSSDNGDTWTLTSFPDTLSVLALAINANDDIFVGTNLGTFRSTDNGETWVQNNIAPIAIAISPVNQHIFATVILDGVYRSTDNGDTWVHTGLRSPAIESLVINSNGEIFAGSTRSGYVSYIEPEGIFYSNDNGNSWSQINDGLTNINVFSLAVDSSGFVYAGTIGSGVFRTVKSTTERN